MNGNNDHNKNKTRRPNSDDIANVSTFGPMTYPSGDMTPGSTPRAPPMGILTTPFFQKDSYTYSTRDIHPATLRSLNGNDSDSFDTEGVDGYRQPISYNVYNASPDHNRMDYSHTTVDYNINHPPSTPVPSLRPQPPITEMIQSPYNQQPVIYDSNSRQSILGETTRPTQQQQQQQQQPQQIRYTNNIKLTHEPSAMSKIYDILKQCSLNNAVVWILTVVIAYLFVTISVYETDNNVAIDPQYQEIMKNLTYLNQTTTKLAKELKDEKLKNKELNEQLNETMSEINKTLVKRVNMNENHIFDINDTMNIHENELIELNKTMNNTVKIDTIEPILEFVEYLSNFNWITRISGKPKAILCGGLYSDSIAINDDSDKKDKDEHGDGIIGTFTRGLERFKAMHSTKDEEPMDDLNELSNVNIASTDTSSTLNPQDCLQFSTNQNDRWIEIEFGERIIPKQFIYIHIDKERIPISDRNMSPKQFYLYGKTRNELNWTNIAITEENENNIMGINQSDILLNLEQANDGIDLMKIEYDINDDAKSTRLYRFRVHGDRI